MVDMRIPHTPTRCHRHLGAVVITLAGLACTSPAWAGYEDGVAAYQRGRHELALRQFNDAAARGDARAMRSLGLMHERGDGVPRDIEAAASWYRKAIAQGAESAQFNLAFVTSQSASAKDTQIATSRP